jgi:signal transduction histidine kinase
MLVIFSDVDAAYAEHPQKQVLVLYSVRRDAQLAILGNRDLPRALATGLGEDIDYYSEYLEAARFRVPDYERAFRDFLRLKYQQKRLDVIIAMSDAVTDLVARNRSEFFPDVPVVFFQAGSSNPVRVANSTGVFGNLRLDGTLDLALALQPDLRYAFIVGDGSIEATESLARRQLHRFESRLALTYLSNQRRDDLEARLAALPAHSMVFYLTMNRNDAGDFVHPLDYLDRISLLANAPIYSWVDSAMGHGVVGGVMKDQRAEINEVANSALRVLNGEPADSIPLTDADVNVAQVDWRELRRWHIDETAVPATTVIRFRELGLWDRYRSYLLGVSVVVIGQTALIGLLLFQRARRKQAEARAHGAQAKLRANYDRIRDLGGRLLMAQEAERSRIARELHDDIGQQLAMLAINLEHVRASASNVGQAFRDVIEQALERARSVSKTLHDLSHRLHPNLLGHMGLAGALQRMIDEVPHDSLEIVFEHSGVPVSLPQDVILCVFRIAQEALQNVVRHSAAHHVSIHLDGSETELVLRVDDDGVGFASEAATKGGLGLLSMAERLDALDGLLNISSRPGMGTSLTVVVPLRPGDSARPRPTSAPPVSKRSAHSLHGRHDIS